MAAANDRASCSSRRPLASAEATWDQKGQQQRVPEEEEDFTRLIQPVSNLLAYSVMTVKIYAFNIGHRLK